MFGGDPFENDAITQQICFCAENQVYPDYFRVRDVFTAARLLYPTWDAAYAEELVELFELPKKRRVVKLSRGMRSAVGIVTGLASRAPLTMFDEPYLGLDATARQLFYNQLLADYAENPRTILLSTHLIDEVSELIEHVLVVDRGQLVIDEEAERLRGRAITISGPADTVDKFTYAMTRLHEERLLGQSRVTVLGDADDPQHARALGLDVKPVSLQELVVQSTSGEYRRRTMNRVLSAARLHLVSGQAITVPWSIMGSALAINLVIFGTIQAKAGVQDNPSSGGLASLYAVVLTVFVQAMNKPLQFALGLSLTRRTYLLGSAVFATALSFGSALVLYALYGIERATDGWGVDLSFFGAWGLGEGNPVVAVLGYDRPLD